MVHAYHSIAQAEDEEGTQSPNIYFLFIAEMPKIQKIAKLPTIAETGL